MSRGPMHHLDLTVQDLERSTPFYQRALGFLQELGATVLDAPADYPQYRPGYYAEFFADPDGLKLEYVYTPAR